MKKPKMVVISLAATYGSMIGLGVLRILRGKQAYPLGQTLPPELARREALTEERLALPAPPPPKPEEELLPSLSLKTPGYDSLDELARRSQFEEEYEVIVSAGGVRIETQRAAPTGEPQPWTHDSEDVKELLRTQSLEIRPLTGWASPRPHSVPVPTFAPAVLSFGVVMFAMGLATSWYVCVVGAAILALAAKRWAAILGGG